MDTITRPVLDRTQQGKSGSTAMPKINVSVFKGVRGSCVPSNCCMFTPGGNKEVARPVISR